MADKVAEQIDLPLAPVLPDPALFVTFGQDQNRQLIDYLSALSRKANAGDLSDGGTITGDVDVVGDVDVTGDFSGTGTFSWTGGGSFSGALTVADEAYDDAGWNGDLSVPTKNAIRDIWETLGTAAFEDTGTSGATVPLLDAAATWDMGAGQMNFVGNTSGSLGAVMTLRRDATAAAGVFAGILNFTGPNDLDAETAYGQFNVYIEDETDGTEDGQYWFATTRAGTLAIRMILGSGLYSSNATGGDQGVDTLNFSTIYRNANLVPGPASQAQGDILYRGASDWSRLGIGTYGQVPSVNSGATAPEYTDRAPRTAAQATTSGTSVTFSVPSWARMIAIVMDQVSISTGDDILVQLADAGGTETTGYNSVGTTVTASAVASTANTSGFLVRFQSASREASGIFFLANLTGNVWTMFGGGGGNGGTTNSITAGTKTLSATITSVVVSRTGAGSFDLGQISVIYW